MRGLRLPVGEEGPVPKAGVLRFQASRVPPKGNMHDGGGGAQGSVSTYWVPRFLRHTVLLSLCDSFAKQGKRLPCMGVAPRREKSEVAEQRAGDVRL